MFGPCTCTPTCKMVNQNVPCTQTASPTSECCHCREGLVRDDVTGACVQISNCTCLDIDG